MSNIKVIVENESKEVKLFVKRISKKELLIYPEKSDETYYIINQYPSGRIELAKLITYITTALTNKVIELNIVCEPPEIEYKGYTVEQINVDLYELFKDYEYPEDTEDMIKNLAKYIKQKVSNIIEKVKEIDSELEKTYEITIKIPKTFD